MVLSQLTPAQRQKGLVTMSAGNFGRSFSAACQAQQVSGVVCMPDDVPKDRVTTCESMGARVVLCDRQQLMNTVAKVEKEEGRLFVHPFDDLNLIRGHASCGLEILEDLKNEVDLVAVPCGGGGLLAGLSAAIKLNPEKKGSPKVVCVEPEGAPKMYLSNKHQSPQTLTRIDTIAAGLSAPFAGPITFRHARKYVDDFVILRDKWFRRACDICFTEFGLVVEPSGVAAFAALLAGQLGSPDDLENKIVVIVLSGRNVTIDEILKRDLVSAL